MSILLARAKGPETPPKAHQGEEACGSVPIDGHVNHGGLVIVATSGTSALPRLDAPLKTDGRVDEIDNPYWVSKATRGQISKWLDTKQS